MREEEATESIGADYDYIEQAAQAVADRQRYFDAMIRSEVKKHYE